MKMNRSSHSPPRFFFRKVLILPGFDISMVIILHIPIVSNTVRLLYDMYYLSLSYIIVRDRN